MWMDLLGIGLIVQPIWLIRRFPDAFGQPVTSLFFSETSQDFWSLGSNSAFVCRFYEFLSGYRGRARSAASSSWSNGFATKPTDGRGGRRWLVRNLCVATLRNAPMGLG